MCSSLPQTLLPCALCAVVQLQLQVNLGVQSHPGHSTVCSAQFAVLQHSLHSTGCAGVQQSPPDSATGCSCTASKFQLQLQVNLGVQSHLDPATVCSAHSAQLYSTGCAGMHLQQSSPHSDTVCSCAAFSFSYR